MKYPYLSNVSQGKDLVSEFRGLDAKLTSCTEGEFYDCRNITTQYYPVLSTRPRRSLNKTFTSLQGILDKESLIWIDNGALYIDGVKKYEGITTGLKTITKIGAFIVIMPDKIWYNCDNNEHGNIEASKSVTGKAISMMPCKADGTTFTPHDEAYYKTNTPTSGSIMVVYDANNNPSYKVYSELTNMWSAVTSTYFSLGITGETFGDFKEGDGIKISIQSTELPNVFVNDDGDGWHSVTTVIKRIESNKLIITGIIGAEKSLTVPIKINRSMPDMEYLTECQNRLWGCSKDGHEIYCCKLGDVTNWNCFSGIASDSYAATVGSDGKFTAAISYNNNPIFFKEHSFIKVTVSSNGAHSYREQVDRGVQEGSSKSLVNVNGVLFYKGVTDVYAFDGSSPVGVGEALGEHRYYSAVSGTINGRYYMSAKDAANNYTMFVYDTKNNLWAKEDEVCATYFCNNKDNLYFVSNNQLIDVFGGGEAIKNIKWSAESGYIGFNITGNKYVSKMNIRMSLALDSYCDIWIKYDEETQWRHVWNMSGKGTKAFTIPVNIQRCDHFRYKLTGTGECKIYTISKTVEEGSDV